MTKKLKLDIQGMHCQSCAKMIEIELEEKVNNIKINSVSGKAEMDFDEDKISEKEIKNIIFKMGYKIK